MGQLFSPLSRILENSPAHFLEVLKNNPAHSVEGWTIIQPTLSEHFLPQHLPAVLTCELLSISPIDFAIVYFVFPFPSKHISLSHYISCKSRCCTCHHKHQIKYACIFEGKCFTLLYFYIYEYATLQIVKDWIELVGLLLNWWVCHHSWQCEPGQDLTNVDFLARMIYKSASHN